MITKSFLTYSALSRTWIVRCILQIFPLKTRCEYNCKRRIAGDKSVWPRYSVRPRASHLLHVIREHVSNSGRCRSSLVQWFSARREAKAFLGGQGVLRKWCLPNKGNCQRYRSMTACWASLVETPVRLTSLTMVLRRSRGQVADQGGLWPPRAPSVLLDHLEP